MKVLILGAGGREHALAWKISQSPLVKKVFVAPGNDGIQTIAETIALNSHAEILDFVAKNTIDLTLIGQEIYLVEGLADQLRAHGHRVFGPSAKAARLEGSKQFAKEFMQRHRIPTAAFGAFQDVESAYAFLQTLSPPYVIKASGLAAGKGVILCQTLNEARETLVKMMETQIFGEAGSTVVIEEFLAGEEASYFVVTDGERFVPLASAQDHKRIGELDQGANTGGMGAYSPAPVLNSAVERKVLHEIVMPTIYGMAQEGHPYCGVLYVGLMIHEGQPRVIEYNCRFGDPECQVLMMRCKSDLFPVLLASAENRLNTAPLQWRKEAAVCLIMAAPGYPDHYPKGLSIAGIDQFNTKKMQQSTYLFHAGTKKINGKFVTQGGRVLGVTSRAKTLEDALSRAYAWLFRIDWERISFRRDIGLKGLLPRTEKQARAICALILDHPEDPLVQGTLEHLNDHSVTYFCLQPAARPQNWSTWICEQELDGVQLALVPQSLPWPILKQFAFNTQRLQIILYNERDSKSGRQDPEAQNQISRAFPLRFDSLADAARAAIPILAIHDIQVRVKWRMYRLQSNAGERRP